MGWPHFIHLVRIKYLCICSVFNILYKKVLFISISLFQLVWLYDRKMLCFLALLERGKNKIHLGIFQFLPEILTSWLTEVPCPPFSSWVNRKQWRVTICIVLMGFKEKEFLNHDIFVLWTCFNYVWKPMPAMLIVHYNLWHWILITVMVRQHLKEDQIWNENAIQNRTRGCAREQLVERVQVLTALGHGQIGDKWLWGTGTGRRQGQPNPREVKAQCLIVDKLK